MKYPLLLPVLFILPGILYAQDFTEVGSFTKKYPNESVVILEHREQCAMNVSGGNLTLSSDIHQQILFLDRNARSLSSKSVEHHSFYDIKDLEASTLVPEKGKFRKIKVTDFNEKKNVSDDHIFHDDSRVIEFIYPNVSEGCVTELNYKRIVKEPRLWPGFYFGSYVPVESAEYSVTLDPEITIGWKYFNVDTSRLIFLEKKSGNRTTYAWKMTGIPKTEYETESLSQEYLCPHIYIYIKKYRAGKKEIRIADNLNDLYDWFRGLISGITPPASADLFHLVDSVSGKCLNPEEKLARLYLWVQRNIKYVAFEEGYGGFIPRDPDDVFAKRYGDCKDMSALLHYMLKHAGLQSSLTWIGTRDLPYSFHDLPSPVVTNHMIVTARIDTSVYFLDPTSYDQPWYLPSSFIQGKDAMVNIDDKRYEILKVPVIGYTHNRIMDEISLFIDGNILKGEGKTVFTGYHKQNFAGYLEDKTYDELKTTVTDLYKKGSNKFLIDSVAVLPTDDMKGDLVVKYRFNIKDYLYTSGKEIYLNMNLDPFLRDIFIEPDRKNAVERPFQEERNYTVNLFIPPGFEIVSVPQNHTYKNNLFGYKIKYYKEGSYLTANRWIYMNHLLLGSEYFDEWNEMVKKLNRVYNESVIIVKNR
ncbi:MAG: DUF3857 domain-containing protein [Bacteroidetes bacterium]|nr:DUF3857 domain-containing protein [Bacteroidota bacterium]